MKTMTVYLCVACLLLLYVGEARGQSIPQNPNKIDKKGRRQGKWTIAFDGKWRKTDLKDNIAYYRLLAYRDGKPQGIARDFYLSGQKQWEGTLLADAPEDVLHGQATWFYESGQKSSEVTYQNGQRVGKGIDYHENGQIASEVMYENGQKAGKETNYYPSGKIESIIPYQAGKREGRAVAYYENGAVKEVGFYEKGEEIPLNMIWENAVKLYNNGGYAEAEPIFLDMYATICYKFGKDDKNCAFVAQSLWNTKAKLGKKDEAMPYIEEMIRVRDLQKIPKDSIFCDWLYEAMVWYKEQGKIKEIELILWKIITIQQEIGGKEGALYLTYRSALSDYYLAYERYKEAEKISAENIALYEKAYPENSQKSLPEWKKLAEAFEKIKTFQETEKLYQMIIRNGQARQDTSRIFTQILTDCVSMYLSRAKEHEALPYARYLLALQEERKGTESPEYNRALLELSKVYREIEEFETAGNLIQIRLESTRKLYGETGYEYANVLFDKGLLEASRNNWRKAADFYKQAIAALAVPNAEQKKDYYQARWAEIGAYLGDAYMRDNDQLQAQLAMSEAAERAQKITTRNNILLPHIYEKIAIAQKKLGNYAESEALLAETVALTRLSYGDQHHNTFVSMGNLCLVQSYNEKKEAALQTIDSLLVKAVSLYGKNSHTYINLLNDKLAIWEMDKNLDSVVAIRQETIAFYREKYGEDSRNYFDRLTELVKNQIIAGRFEEARKNIEKLQYLADKKGEKAIDETYYAEILPMKIFLESSQKNYAKSMEYAQELNAIGRFLGKPKLGLLHLGMSNFSMGNFKEALRYYKIYIDLVMQDLQKVFPYLSDEQRLGFYNTEVQHNLDFFYFFSLAEPLGIKLGERDSLQKQREREEMDKIKYIKHPNNVDVFQYHLLTKGILFESSQKMKKAILTSGDTSLIRLFDEWQAKKEQLIKIVSSSQVKFQEAKRNALAEEVKNIERKLALKSSYFTERIEQKNYTWKDIQKKLKKGEALVDILAIDAGKKLDKKRKYADLYLAFVITPETKDYPLCVKLGAGDSLEGKYMLNYQNCIKYKSVDKYSYDKFWKPLADTLKGAQRIYFSPDGLYHKINPSGLMNPETGRYVLEEKEVVYTGQVRDLLQERKAAAMPKELILFGSPAYNASPTERMPLPANTERALVRSLKQDTTQRFFQADEIKDLPHTEEEINRIAQLAEREQLTVRKYLGAEAREEILKNIKNPTILHIATHGFFISKDFWNTDGAEDTRSFAGFDRQDLLNPLRRSGLLLAYCRQAFLPDKNKVFLPEDGILLAEEVQNLYLDKTDLVVLSACETGLGDIRSGEGVYGLQRAFQTAGAQSVLMSLWAVNDQATQELMTEFYVQWFRLKDKAKALREAQIRLKERYPHPYYWGAFILVEK